MATRLLLVIAAVMVATVYSIPTSVVQDNSEEKQDQLNDASLYIEPRDSSFNKQLGGADREIQCDMGVTLLGYNERVTFQTPNYPNDYPVSKNCTWELKGQTADTRILIMCHDIEMEVHDTDSWCSWDYLDIEGTRYCGKEFRENTPIWATSNTVKMSFVSDEWGGAKGFHCIADAMEPPTESPTGSTTASDREIQCGMGVTLLDNYEHVTFQTPNYPNDYPLLRNCTWELKGETAGTMISIHCDDFELEQRYETWGCSDYFDIDGTRYCGSELTDSTVVYSTTNTVKMSFVSDDSFTHKGFNCRALAFGDYFPPSGPPTGIPTGLPTSSCGRVNRVQKIVGGVETELHEYPWHVGFAYNLQSQGSMCGGSIINEWWVLTAAHCWMAEGNFVVVGEHDWSTDTETSATQKIAIEQVLRHPNYNRPSVLYDVALIKLASPLTFDADNKVAPVCPPSPNDLYEDVDAILTGWGRTIHDIWESSSDSLLEVVVPTMTNSECRSTYPYITDGMICAGYPQGGKDSCQGDSGGPMFTADGDIFRQIGIVSHGYGCGLPGIPGVYNRVTSELEWIRTTISGTNWDEPITGIDC